MIAAILTIPISEKTDDDKYFSRFVKEADGLMHAYQLESGDEIIVLSMWISEAKRDAFMATQLRSDVDKSYPSGTRKVYRVTNVG